MNRRNFVKSAALTAVSLSTACQTKQRHNIIDAHTHFYDPTRPEGVTWPNKKSPLYRKVMPRDFLHVASPFGVTGTVVVEASSRLEDNQWILDVAKENKSIVGFVGNVDPTIDNWESHIKRFAKDKVFRGIRLKKSMFSLGSSSIMRKMKTLADLDLTVDLNGGLQSFEAAEKLAKALPTLRIVIEHLPGREGIRPSIAYKEALAQVKDFPNVYVKVSSVLVKSAGKVISEPSYYKDSLDLIWENFGENKLIYGSNWPVSDLYNGEYKDVFNVVDTYFTAKGPKARSKYFAENAAKAYKWVKR